MATYDLKYPGAAIDAILDTAYHLQQAGYIFRGSASDYSGTPTEREWVIAPAGFSGLGLSSAVPQGSIGICLYNGTSWTGKIIHVLTLDSGPTRNSQNGVTSGGVAATLDEIAGGIMATFASLLFDDETAAADLSTKLSYAVKFSVSDVYQTVTHLNILAATTSKAGLMSAEDKAKVDSFLANLRSLTFADTTASADQGTKITETLKATIGGVQEVIDSITLLAATSSKAGLLSASDKAYIDALPATLTSLSNSISGALALMQSLVGYYVCDTAAGTAAKTVAATGYSLTNGGCIRIKMTNANTAANVTLNINSTGAKALYYDGTQASSTNTWEAGEVLEVYYDGTQYQCASGGGGKFVKDLENDISFERADNNSEEVVISSDNDILVAKFGTKGSRLNKVLDSDNQDAILFNTPQTDGGENCVKITDDNDNVVIFIDKNGLKVKSITTLDGGSTGDKICVPIFKQILQDFDFSLYPINGNVAVLGDSTVAGQGAGRKVSSNLTITGSLTDISTSGDTVVGQTNKWNALSSQVKSTLNYVIVEIGLNDMTSETLANDVVLFNSYQTLIRTIRTDAPNSKIILSKMTPAHSRFINIYGKERGDIAYNNWIELNDAIDRLLFIGANTSVSYHVNIMGDDYGNLISEYDTGDQIHPNIAGGKVIAWSWLTGILK